MKKFFKILSLVLVFAIALMGLLMAVFPPKGYIPILMYHFIDTPERAAYEKNVVSLESFKRQMRVLKWFGFRVITLDDYYDALTGEREPGRREVVLTFDDANYTFQEKAFPVLKHYGYPSTVFAVSQNVEQHLHGSMTRETLTKLAATGLVSIESHSRTHPSLSHLDEKQIREELEGSKRELEAMFGRPVHYFAYPSGDIDTRVVNLAEEAGYRLAFTTSPEKRGDLSENHFTLTRIKISRTSDFPIAFWIKISGIYEWVKKFRETT